MASKVHLPVPAAVLKADAIAKTLALGRSHHNQGHLKLAEGCYRQVLAMDSNNADGLHLLGVVAFQSDAVEQGIRLIKRAARKSPRDPAIFVNLGAAYRKAKRNIEAREAYETALKLKPDLWEAHFNLGKALVDLGDFDGAIAAYNHCIVLKPTSAEVYVNLGNVYKFKDDGDNAIAAYERALALDPKMSQAYGNIAAVFVDRGRHAEALALMDKAIAIDPQPGELRFKRSLIALRLANFAVGWADYDSRFFAETEKISRFSAPPPYWTGEDLTEKTILLWTEQGLGDEILYAGMIGEVAARARRCIVECSPRLVPVFARSFPQAIVKRYLGQGERATPPADFDVQISITSLGKYFRPSLKDFPRHQGYLKGDRMRTAALRARYRAIAPGNLVVGLSWRSKSDRLGVHKSADLATWADVLRVPGVTFVNLQYGDCAAELATVKQALGVDIVQDPEINPLGSMDEFFAQVAAMDLVITTSNTTVHVAGSLNIPTSLLLPSGIASLWYWFLNSADSPWYPSINIFCCPLQVGNVNEPNARPWWADGIMRIGEMLASKSQERLAASVAQSA